MFWEVSYTVGVVAEVTFSVNKSCFARFWTLADVFNKIFSFGNFFAEDGRIDIRWVKVSKTKEVFLVFV